MFFKNLFYILVVQSLALETSASNKVACSDVHIWPDEKMDNICAGVIYRNSEWLASSQLQSCLWRWNRFMKQIQITNHKILLSPSVPPSGCSLCMHRKTWKRITRRLTMKATVVVVRIMTDLPVAPAGPSRSTHDKLEHEGVCIANLCAQVKSMTVSCQRIHPCCIRRCVWHFLCSYSLSFLWCIR